MSFKVKYIRGAVESGQLRFNISSSLCAFMRLEPPWILFVIHKMGLQPPPSHTTFTGLGENGKMADNNGLGLWVGT